MTTSSTPRSKPAPNTGATTPVSIRFEALLVPFICFFLSGASGLIFEVIWTRKLSLVFGASTPAISTVLTAFMGGLALGSYLFGRFADRLKFPILTYALMEAGVGVFALLVPFIVDHGYPPISRLITNHGGNSFDAFTLLRFVVVALVLLPPTTLMGATLPLLTRHFVQRGDGLGQRVGALYAVNTFGAVAGTFCAGFLLLPTIGLFRTNLIAGLTNLFLASLIVVFRRALLGDSWPKRVQELLPWHPASRREAESEPAKETAVTAEPASDESPSAAPSGSKRKKRKGGAAAAERAEREASDELPTSPEQKDVPSDLDLIDEPNSRTVRWATLVAAAGSGFAALAYEVILSRALDMVIGSSIYSFTIILMAFLVGIGGGSALASAILKARPGPAVSMAVAGAFLGVSLLAVIVYGTSVSKMVFAITAVVVMLCLVVAATYRKPTLALGAVQMLIGIAAACTYYFQDKIPKMFVYLAMVSTDSCDPSRPLAFSQHTTMVQWISFVTAALCALPAALGMGAAFPLAVRAFARSKESIGSDTGSVYSVNTLGSIAGSFLTGFILLPAVGMETAFYIAVSVNLAIALALLLASPGEEPAKYVLVPLTALLLALALTGTVFGRDGRVHRSQGRFSVFLKPWNLEAMTLGVFRLSIADGMIARRQNQCMESEPGERESGMDDDNPIYYRDGVTTTVTVERWTLGEHTHFALKNNGKVDASNGDDMPTQLLVSAYPLLLHRGGPTNLDVAIVGWGSGTTVGTTLQFPVKHVDVIELERATIDGSRYFADVNHLRYNLPEFPYVTMPRLTIHNNDGRNYLAGTDHRYDVIISEPSNPWITGVSNLFTIDHFRAASRALAPNGIFLQWVQLYEMSPNNIKTIYRTFAEVFPYVRVFAADAYSSDTIVLGSFSPIEMDVGRIDRFLTDHPETRRALEGSHAQSATDLFARMLFASRDEVRRFAQLEEHNDRGDWVVDLRANGSGVCEPGSCRRRPAPINTDDNALIEFAAPRDLIGFDAFANYVETLFGEEWPYGRAERELTGLGSGSSRVDALAGLGLSLLSAGRPSRAGEVLDAASDVAGPDSQPIQTPTLSRAVLVWRMLTHSEEPALHLEALTPGPDISREGERRLEEAYANATRAVGQGSFRTALAAFADIPATVREHSGPSLRLLYGYLLYKSSLGENAEPHFADAADELERLGQDETAWAARHPELMFYIGRSRFRAGDYALSVSALERFVDMVRTGSADREHESPEVAHDVDEPAIDSAPVSDAAGESAKDRHPGGA